MLVRVLSNPEPDSDCAVLTWLGVGDAQPYKLLTMRSTEQTNVWDALAETDVEITYPHSHVVFDETSGELDVAMQDRLRRDDRPGDRRYQHRRHGQD